MIDGALARRRSRPARSPRSASPTSARPRVIWDRETGEPIHNAIVWQDTRTDELVRELAGRGRRRPPARPRRAAAVDLLLRAEDHLAARSRARARASAPRTGSCCSERWTPGCCGTSPAAPRGGVHATDVDEREPHDADGPADARLARAEPRADGRPAGAAAARSAPRARSTARRPARPRRDGRWPASSATSRRRCSGRPASRAARPRTPTAPARSCCVNTGEQIVRSDALLTSVGYRLGDGPARATCSRARSR